MRAAERVGRGAGLEWEDGSRMVTENPGMEGAATRSPGPCMIVIRPRVANILRRPPTCYETAQ